MQRKIPRSLVERVLESAEQKVQEEKNISCYQCHVNIEGHAYLLRVMVNETVHPPVVVTACRTSKVDKYWRPT